LLEETNHDGPGSRRELSGGQDLGHTVCASCRELSDLGRLESGVEMPQSVFARRPFGRGIIAFPTMGSSATEDKQALVTEFLQKLEDELANMRRAAKDAREAATHEEAKPENDKDTRALEASYLAGAQAARVREIEGAIKAISTMALLDLNEKPVQASAIVTLEDDDEVKTKFFFAPFGGGTTLHGDIQVVTPQSPLGKALLGRTQGEVIEVRAVGVAGRNATMREMTIVDVR